MFKPKYEYLAVTPPAANDIERTKWLNNLASKDWELIYINSTTQYTRAYFRRELKSPLDNF